MKKKYIFLYLLGVLFLIFGNRNLWNEWQDSREDALKLKALAGANKDVMKKFEVQKLKFDSVKKKWINPNYYFQVVNLGSLNFKAIRRGHSSVERDHNEDASESL